jgi:hypothetical protein
MKAAILQTLDFVGLLHRNLSTLRTSLPVGGWQELPFAPRRVDLSSDTLLMLGTGPKLDFTSLVRTIKVRLFRIARVVMVLGL